MSVPPSQGFLEGLRNTRQAQGDGTLQGRVRSAMPASARAVGGRQEAITRSAGPSVRVDTLTLTANSQSIATTSANVVWHNELVGLTPREGFGGYGGTPTDNVTIPVDGRLLTTLTLMRSTATAWTIRWHVTRGTQTLSYDMAAGSSTDPAIAEAPPLTVKSGDVLRVQILQTSGGSETLDSATLHLTLLNVSPRSEPPAEFCAPGDVELSFATPSGFPRGMTWDGTNLWITDISTDSIYKIDPADGTIITSFAAPGTSPWGLAWDGTDLWHSDSANDTIYKLDTSGTVLTSFASPGTVPHDLAWDGTNLWNADNGAVIYKLDTSGTVLDSFASPGADPEGLTWDGTDLWNSDNGSDLIYRISAVDGSVLQSFASPGENPHGLAWDGTHLWNCDSASDLVYQICV